MNKLQLYITRSGANLKSIFNLNPNEDVRRHVTDLKDAVSLVDYNPEEKNIFYMLKSTDDGIFFIILRTIPPFTGHHLATWIYVPGDTVITGREMEEIVRLTTRKISNTEVSNDDVAELREAFNIEYPNAKGAPALTASRGTGYAWRQYGGDTGLSIADYCGRGIFQQAYLPYKGVIITDADLPYTVNAANLGELPLGDEAVILPPEKSDDGFTAHVFGRLLDKPIRGTLDAPLTVVWRRPGFEDVIDEEIVASKEFMPQPVATTDSHKLITPSSFYITSQTTRDQLTDCDIRVNGTEITRDGKSFTPDQLRHASVQISCDGYFTYSGNMDLASSTRALVQMQEKRKVYRFEVPVISSDLGAPIKFEIYSKKALTESPLEGYALLDDIQEGPTRTNHLGFVGKGSPLMSKLIYAGAGLLLGIIFMWLCGTCSRSSESHLAPAAQAADSAQVVADSAAGQEVKAPKTSIFAKPAEDVQAKPQQPEKPAAQAANLNTDDAAAIKYLDENKTWSRESMEKFALLQGLFDDLNNYKADNLKGTWKTKLAKSKTFNQMIEHLNLGARKEKAKKNIAAGPYTADGKIVVYGWECKVDP